MSSILSRFLGAVAALIGIAFVAVWLSGKHADIKLANSVGAVGAATPVTAVVVDPHGLKSFSASIEQNGQAAVVFGEKANSKQKDQTFSFAVGKKAAPFLTEGAAVLRLRAKSNDLWGATTTFTQDVQVILKPPTVVADTLQHYINQGGSELVLLDVGGNWTKAGVRVGYADSLTFPMPGEPDNSSHRFSLFAFPWDVPPDTTALAWVRNGAGTEVTTTFWARVFPKKFRSSNIQLNDRELQKVVGELDPDGSGSLIDRFVRLNRDMRRANAETIFNLRTNTEHRILWSGPFVPVKGARESYFADRRSYFYNGKKIDEQVHLGYDLAQTTNMPVKAANSGRVIYADRLGIYGNCVIIDHGYSLESLYGHLSRILVKVGDSISKEQQIGISGATGMAFGDHVHFSMLVSGYQIDPKEWWDEHWIHDRVLSKIGPGANGSAFNANPATMTPPKTELASYHHARRHRK